MKRNKFHQKWADEVQLKNFRKRLVYFVNDHARKAEYGTKVYTTISKAKKAAKKIEWGSMQRKVLFTSNWASFTI